MMPTETAPPTLLVAMPSSDVYGSDLQMLQTIAVVKDAGWRVVVTSPAEGPLNQRLADLGAEYMCRRAVVLRRADASVAGMIRLVATAARSAPSMFRLLRRVRPDVVLVNTITLPLWPLVGRFARRPVVVHVHEAEDDDPRLLRRAMALPLMFSSAIVVNSRTSQQSLLSVAPRLARRCRLVLNGVEPPQSTPSAPSRRAPHQLIAIGRLSPRKAPGTAIDALALLVAAGRDAELTLVGTPAPGAESFVEQLRKRASDAGVTDRVRFAGYVSPLWPALADAEIVLAPSHGESFGNAVVEAQLALRPVVATDVRGHNETVIDDVTGLLVPVDDPAAMAEAVSLLLDDPERAARVADAGRRSALERYTAKRYRSEMRTVLERLVSGAEGAHVVSEVKN
jgi:glycosyltransferase involved in cell wall biosynthesis